MIIYFSIINNHYSNRNQYYSDQRFFCCCSLKALSAQGMCNCHFYHTVYVAIYMYTGDLGTYLWTNTMPCHTIDKKLVAELEMPINPSPPSFHLYRTLTFITSTCLFYWRDIMRTNQITMIRQGKCAVKQEIRSHTKAMDQE